MKNLVILLAMVFSVGAQAAVTKTECIVMPTTEVDAHVIAKGPDAPLYNLMNSSMSWSSSSLQSGVFANGKLGIPEEKVKSEINTVIKEYYKGLLEVVGCHTKVYK